MYAHIHIRALSFYTPTHTHAQTSPNHHKSAHTLTHPSTTQVATDAVGMGLNLNIRRIVFSQVDKFDGQMTRKLTDTEIRQIAGRAGRYKSVYPVGEVTW